MHTYFMFGKYSPGSLREISAERTTQVRELIAKMGGSVRGIYALLGEHDVVLIVDLSGMTNAMKCAVALGQLTGIVFSTCAAVPVEEFDVMVDNLPADIESAQKEGRR